MTEQVYRARTLPQVIQDAAAQHGTRVAISDGPVNLTYTELNEARVRAARAFLAAGLAQGDRVAIWAPNIYQWILAAIGAQSVGGVVVPLNTRYKGAEAAYVLNASGARMLFTVGDFLGVSYPALLAEESVPALERTVLLAGEAEGVGTWEAFLAEGDAVPEADAEARAAALSRRRGKILGETVGELRGLQMKPLGEVRMQKAEAPSPILPVLRVPFPK